MHIANTVRKRYQRDIFRLSEWADVVNLSVPSGGGIVEALEQIVTLPDFPFLDQRAFLVLAEMSSKANLPTRDYT